jgi:hypothetical protein
VTEGTVQSIDEVLKVLREKGYISANHSQVRFLYRGHGMATWKLDPGVYREEFKVGTLREGEDEEDARLRTEQHLSQDFRILSAGLRTGRETDLDIYFLQQHHGMPTRLLDWTNNPLAALYFAVANKHNDKSDGMFFAMDAYKLASDQGADRTKDDVQGIATSGRKYLTKAVAVITKWKKKADFGNYAIALRPDHFDARMSLQRSCFTFHVPKCPRLEPDRLNCLRAFTIPAAAKAQMRSELAVLGIDDFSIYGDLDHLAQRLKAVYLKQLS